MKEGLVSSYTYEWPFDDEHSILKTFYIYVSYNRQIPYTRISIVNADTKRECCAIGLGYILREENRIYDAAKALIDTNLLL